MKINPPQMEENITEFKTKTFEAFPPKDEYDIDEKVWHYIEEFIKTDALYEITDITFIQPNSKLVIIKLGEGYCDTLINVFKKHGKIQFECIAAKWAELIQFTFEIEPDEIETNKPEYTLYWKFRTIQDAHFYNEKDNNERSWENDNRLQGCKDRETSSDGSF